jgi:hypothetical protein
MDVGPGRPSVDGGGRATTQDGTFGSGLSRLLLAIATGLALVAALPVSAAVAGSKPSNTSPPTVSGVPRVGQTLSADPGTWSGAQPITYKYQWRRCRSWGGSCVDISGARGQTHQLTAADIGSTVRIRVRATNSAGSSSADSAPTAVVESPPVNTSPPAVTGTLVDGAPQNTGAPTISGTAQQSLLLTAGPGTWTGTAPIAFAYQWRRCGEGATACADIAGATSQGYTPVAADVGSSLRVAVTATNASGSATAESAPTSTVTVAGSVGYRGPSFTGAGTAPTGSKPESKLWFNDGAWWAAMWAGSGRGFHIFRLDPASQRWSDTGVALDDRSGTRADVLSDGSRLYVASHVFASCGCSTTAAGFPSRLYRYSYDAAARTYSLDPGFPVQLNNTKTETLVIDRDSTGTVWATWVQDRRVMLTHTLGGDDRSWVAPYVLPVAGASNPSTDDISSLVAYAGNAIAVMWSNQTDSAFYFASHADGAADSAWTVAPALQSPLIADDHLNLKSLHSDGTGRVFAIAKTSLNDVASPDSSAPGVVLMVRTSDGRWSHFPVWRVGDGVTRPMLLVDETNHVLHALATSSESGGTIRLKSSPIGSIAFPAGLGTVFLRDASGTNLLNNATSTKQNLTRVSGMVVLASNDSNGYYWHNAQAVP